MDTTMNQARISHDEMLMLKRWNTPTVYNGWEQFTDAEPAHDGFNLDATSDFMPEMGPMVGRAVTVLIHPGEAVADPASAWREYRRYVAAEPDPKIVVVQDLDRPHALGSFWGEVNANVHRALGCVGTITDGAIRDLDEMRNAGFKAIARRMCVGHAHSAPVAWGVEVEVFGRTIAPGMLIHADKHGFLAVPEEDEAGLLAAARFMDDNECSTLIAAARSATGKSRADVLEALDHAAERFGRDAMERFSGRGEWA